MRDLILSQRDASQVQLAIVAGMEVAAGARSKADYYHSKEEQTSAVVEAVEKMYSVSKEIPLLLACQQGATGFFTQTAILNEFKKTANGGRLRIVDSRDWNDDGLGKYIIYQAIENLETNGTPYVMRLFEEMAKAKINNSRSRTICLHWIWSQDSLVYLSIKYRGKLKRAFEHFYGKKLSGAMIDIIRRGVGSVSTKEKEILQENLYKFSLQHSTETVDSVYFYVMTGTPTDSEELPLYQDLISAHTDILSTTRIPVEVLEGMISDPGHPQHELWVNEASRAALRKELRESNKTTTATAAVRQTRQNAKIGVVNETRLEDADPIALLKTAYETGFTDELQKAIDKLAKKFSYKSFPYRRFGVLVDSSASMQGHSSESKNTPRAIANFTMGVLVHSGDAVYTERNSNVARGFLNLLHDTSVRGDDLEAVFIISDGYENDYEGLLNQVVTSYRKITGSEMPVYHISPVGGAEVNAKARSMGKNIVTMNANWKNLPIMLQAKSMETDIRLWLNGQFKSLLGEN